jgi:hypothetical protein
MKSRVTLGARVSVWAIVSALSLNLFSAYGSAQQPESIRTNSQSQTDPPVQSVEHTPERTTNNNAESAPIFASAPQEGSTQSPRAPLPDSPGTVQHALPSQVAAQEAGPSAQPESARGPEPQAKAPQAQGPPREPLGTAAAESVPITGVAASRPAGAAVAPAKQRRVRSILIKVGALAGAGVAVGTVVALSHGSPSKPPGAN